MWRTCECRTEITGGLSERTRLPLALALTFAEEDRSWGLASLAQVIYTWAMIVALMGAFRAFLAKERRGVRYLSDSSYWLYLAHLPLIIAAQAWIRDWDLPSGVKFFSVTIGASAPAAHHLPAVRPLHPDRHNAQRQTNSSEGACGRAD